MKAKPKLLEQFEAELKNAGIDGSNLEMSMEEWLEKVMEAAKVVVGESTPRVGSLQRNCAWWSPKLSRLKAGLKATRRKLDRYRRKRWRSAHLHNRVAELSDEFRRSLKEAERAFWRKKRSELDFSPEKVREAFKLYHQLDRGAKSPIPHTREVMEEAWRGVFSQQPPEECEEKASQEWLEAEEWYESWVDDWSAESEITFVELRSAIDKLPRGKATGADGISNEMLQCLSDDAVLALRNVFNSVLRSPREKSPDVWFHNLVCLLPKVENPDPLQFRPITLLSCVAKLLELVLWERIKKLDIPLQFNQGGFVLERGCVEQVWRLEVCQQRMRKLKRKGLGSFSRLKESLRQCSGWNTGS